MASMGGDRLADGIGTFMTREESRTCMGSAKKRARSFQRETVPSETRQNLVHLEREKK